jgi:serine/threonine protein kinase
MSLPVAAPSWAPASYPPIAAALLSHVKVNLDREALAVQISGVTSLRSHPNIVALEADSFLLLLLESVPGEDLFYFPEQPRDHYDSESPTNSSTSSLTPPTPSLLSTLHPSQQLSRIRLQSISSMFSQMCEAAAACHDQQVFRRDIMLGGGDCHAVKGIARDLAKSGPVCAFYCFLALHSPFIF